MNKRTRSILAIMLMTTALSGIYLFWGISHYRDSIDQKMAVTQSKTDIIIKEVIRLFDNV